MKYTTNKEQTQHLMDLGFPKTNIVDVEGMLFCTLSKYYATGKDEYENDVCYDNYTVGELIDFLGMHLMGIHPTTVCNLPIVYAVQYKKDINSVGYVEVQGELIDKLYEACVKLKNKGVI